MKKIVLEPTSQAQWHSLVTEAEEAARRPLTESLESYLVFTLMRFTTEARLAASVVGVEFLESLRRAGPRKASELRDVGDKCLLFSGLFPHLARRRLVRASYFVEVGRSAYHEAHINTQAGEAELFRELAEDFVALTDVLNTIRTFDEHKPELDALAAFELWADTDSHHALGSVKARASRPDQVTLVRPDEEGTAH